MKKTFFYLTYLVFSVLILILCVEGLGRVVIHMRYGVPGKSYGLWKHDPELGATYRPNSYNTLTSLNNFGFRNKEDVFDPKPEHSLRIIAIGGSTTFGYNLPDGQTFTEKLEEQLKKVPGFERTQVLNGGQICYSTGHSLIRIKRIVPELKPNYVILYEGLNEILNAWVLTVDGISLDELHEKKIYGVLGKRQGQNRWLERNSIIIRVLNYLVQRTVSNMRKNETVEESQGPALEARAEQIRKVIDHPWVLENFKYLFNHMIDALLAESVTPIVVRYSFTGPSEVKVFSDLSAQIAREKGVPVADMRSRFEQSAIPMKDLFIHTGIHVTPKGAEILADELYQTILKDLGERED